MYRCELGGQPRPGRCARMFVQDTAHGFQWWECCFVVFVVVFITIIGRRVAIDRFPFTLLFLLLLARRCRCRGRGSGWRRRSRSRRSRGRSSRQRPSWGLLCLRSSHSSSWQSSDEISSHQRERASSRERRGRCTRLSRTQVLRMP